MKIKLNTGEIYELPDNQSLILDFVNLTFMVEGHLEKMEKAYDSLDNDKYERMSNTYYSLLLKHRTRYRKYLKK